MKAEIIEKPIWEHPDWNTPKNDWGVIFGGWGEEHWDGEPGKVIEFKPAIQNRENWREDLEGMSLADQWDDESSDWHEWACESLKGVRSFRVPVIKIEG